MKIRQSGTNFPCRKWDYISLTHLPTQCHRAILHAV